MLRPRSLYFFFLGSAQMIHFSFSIGRPWQIFVLLLATQRHFKKMFYITKADAIPFICITFVRRVCLSVFKLKYSLQDTYGPLIEQRKPFFYISFIKWAKKETQRQRKKETTKTRTQIFDSKKSHTIDVNRFILFVRCCSHRVACYRWHFISSLVEVH